MAASVPPCVALPASLSPPSLPPLSSPRPSLCNSQGSHVKICSLWGMHVTGLNYLGASGDLGPLSGQDIQGGVGDSVTCR